MRKVGTPTAMFRLASHRCIALRTENFHYGCFIIRALTANKQDGLDLSVHNPSRPKTIAVNTNSSGEPRSGKQALGHRTFPVRNPAAERRILASYSGLAWGVSNMPDQEWVKTLEDGRKVKFIYQELPEDGAFITAQIGGNEVVYSVVLTKAKNPLSHEDVESHFRGELSKR
jgi:hypothetical protein